MNGVGNRSSVTTEFFETFESRADDLHRSHSNLGRPPLKNLWDRDLGGCFVLLPGHPGGRGATLRSTPAYSIMGITPAVAFFSATYTWSSRELRPRRAAHCQQLLVPTCACVPCYRPVRLAYQSPASSTFISEQTSHHQPANSILLSEQTSTNHHQPAERTDPMPSTPTRRRKLRVLLSAAGAVTVDHRRI
jgi:hypothetical protein